MFILKKKSVPASGLGSALPRGEQRGLRPRARPSCGLRAVGVERAAGAAAGGPGLGRPALRRSHARPQKRLQASETWAQLRGSSGSGLRKRPGRRLAPQSPRLPTRVAAAGCGLLALRQRRGPERVSDAASRGRRAKAFLMRTRSGDPRGRGAGRHRRRERGQVPARGTLCRSPRVKAGGPRGDRARTSSPPDSERPRRDARAESGGPDRGACRRAADRTSGSGSVGQRELSGRCCSGPNSGPPKS